MKIRDWFHHLLNPHCEHCKEVNEDSKICKSCETLKTQLEIANYEKKQLLQAVLDNHKPVETQPASRPDSQFNLAAKSIPWAVRKQMMEAEDRKEAELRKKAASQNKTATADLELEELERSLGIVEG